MRSSPKNKHKIDSFLKKFSNDCLLAIIASTETKVNNATAETVRMENYLLELGDSLSHAGGVRICILKG